MFEAMIAAFSVPPIVFAIERWKTGATKALRSALVSFAVIDPLRVASAVAGGRYLDSRLAAFDLDGDGIFSGAETSPEQERALLDVTNDVGRNLAPITGAIVALVLSVGFFGGVSLVRLATRTSTRAAPRE